MALKWPEVQFFLLMERIKFYIHGREKEYGSPRNFHPNSREALEDSSRVTTAASGC